MFATIAIFLGGFFVGFGGCYCWVRLFWRRALIPLVLDQSTIGTILPGCGRDDCDSGVCRHSDEWEGFMVRVQVGKSEHRVSLRHLLE